MAALTPHYVADRAQNENWAAAHAMDNGPTVPVERSGGIPAEVPAPGMSIRALATVATTP